MEPMMHLKVGKVIVSIVWVLIAIAVVEPSQIPFAQAFEWLGAFLVISHVVEITVLRERMRGPKDYALTMLYGALQLKTIRLSS
ncbi:DUF1145 domain-containing protein [Erythrobacter sp. Alg231-14]|uniref:DUF1145 domain-containing protein n=1 Tax=Erythrobacter sp. Alg231-14 TaxID=1922225 RepID=UPI000D55A7F3